MINLIIKKGIWVLLALLGFAACEDNIHDFNKQTGSEASNAVYITDSIFTYQVAWSVDMVNSGADTVLAKFPVCLTEPAKSEMKITLDIDNELVQIYNAAHGTSYYPIAVDSLTLDQATLTIEEGQTVSKDSISIAYSKSMLGLTNTKGYLIPLKIRTFKGTDVGIDYEKRNCYLIVNVSQENGVSFKARENIIVINNNAGSGTFDNTFDGLKFKMYSMFNIAGDQEATLTVNNSLIADFNRTQGTDFQPVPEGDFNPMTVTLADGSVSAEGTISYNGNIRTLNDRRGYLVPIEITSVSDANIKIVNDRKVFYAVLTLNNAQCEYVENEADLGTAESDRSTYKIVGFTDLNGGDQKPVPGQHVAPGTDVEEYLNRIFGGGGWPQTQGRVSGNKLVMTIDLGKDVRNISGVSLSASLTTSNISAVDIYYYPNETAYQAGLIYYAGGVNRGAATQYMKAKISEPFNARYIRVILTPTSSAVRLNDFQLYTNN